MNRYQHDDALWRDNDNGGVTYVGGVREYRRPRRARLGAVVIAAAATVAALVWLAVDSLTRCWPR